MWGGVCASVGAWVQGTQLMQVGGRGWGVGCGLDRMACSCRGVAHEGEVSSGTGYAQHR